MPQWIVEKKRDGIPLSEDDLKYFVGGFVDGVIPEYQMSALAMAIYFRGMTVEETAALTTIMMRSGDLVDTSAVKRPKIDKHSTGGIGDKLSLVVAPLAAACGLAVPMISGRGLGITGGTLDKLESIPGYRTGLTEHEFVSILGKCGCSIIGQTERLVPADRKLYALRDVTGTVPSIPLIVASIMSKKLAAGLDGLVLDVKCGCGAFMKDEKSASALARALLDVAKRMGKPASAIITAMDQPLGRTAGNALEVIEAVETLRCEGPDDVVELSLALCAAMILMGDRAASPKEARAMAQAKLASGEAFSKLLEMTALHGGDTSFLETPSRFPSASDVFALPSPVAGTISGVSADKIGRACLILGAGRRRTTDAVDHAVGLSGIRKTGERVSRGDPLAVVHANDASLAKEAAEIATGAFDFNAGAPHKRPLIIQEILE